MTKLGVFLAGICISASLCAIDKREMAYVQQLDPIQTCRYQFEKVLEALDHVDVRSDRYTNVVTVGMGLIEVAGNRGLTLIEKVLWYRELYDKHELITSQVTNQEPMMCIDGKIVSMSTVMTQMLAIKRVLMNKITTLLKHKDHAIEEDTSQQGTITHEHKVSA